VIVDQAHERQLAAGELALLRVLEDGRSRTRVELAEETGLLPAAAAAKLRELAARGLVRRVGLWHSVGQWQLTSSGVHELGGQRDGMGAG
jgi:DNA-binding IclR family transcriptional regulator